jgi:hypothetical protein
MDHGDNAKLADAFSFLCSQKRTGKLLLREEGREGVVFIADGGLHTPSLIDTVASRPSSSCCRGKARRITLPQSKPPRMNHRDGNHQALVPPCETAT